MSELNENPANAFSEDVSTSVEQKVFEFTRENIERHDNIRVVDRDEDTNLDLFCYVRCTNDDSELVKQCRGVVFHGNDIVMKAFGYTSEYTHEQVAELEQLLPNFEEWSCYDAYEGSIMRMFYFSGKWYLSTHRKLNAFRSKWATKESFGTLFKEALESEATLNSRFASLLPDGDNILERFQQSLDREKQYMFLLCNTKDNRIVCHAPEHPTVYHVGTFDAQSGELLMDVDCGIPYPIRRTFTTVKEMCQAVREHIDPMYMQGLCLFGPNNKQVKVVHSNYQLLFKTRGNEPSIKFRYLQVRMMKDVVSRLYMLYPHMREKFDEYENTLYEIAQMIYRSYVQRYIKKQTVTVPVEEFIVMKECHGWYLSDRANNRMTLKKVVNVLNKQAPTNLNHMISRYNNERKKKEMTQPRLYKDSRENSPQVELGVNERPEPIFLKLPPPQLL